MAFGTENAFNETVIASRDLSRRGNLLNTKNGIDKQGENRYNPPCIIRYILIVQATTVSSTPAAPFGAVLIFIDTAANLRYDALALEHNSFPFAINSEKTGKPPLTLFKVRGFSFIKTMPK